MIDPAFYKIYEACQRVGWSGDPKTLAETLTKLNRGIPVEDEFCLMMSWLGRCKLIHRLDQQQYPPESRGCYRVPDFLSVFEYSTGSVPTLVEVKSTRTNKLSWRPDYYTGLVEYGRVVGLPVLLAWKHSPTQIWSLVDLAEFVKARQNYNLTFDRALQNTLMSMLAGDFAINFTPGLGLHFHMRKLTSESERGRKVRIEQAYFSSPAGPRFTSLRGGLWPFFQTLDIDSDVKESATHIHLSFVIKSKFESQFAHRGFPALLPSVERKTWRDLLQQHTWKVRRDDLLEAAREASQNSAVSGIMHIFPQNMPYYLETGRRKKPRRQ